MEYGTERGAAAVTIGLHLIEGLGCRIHQHSTRPIQHMRIAQIIGFRVDI